MEIGLIFALLASVSFAGSVVFVRKASAHTGESFTTTAVSAFMGIPFFAVVLLITGDWSNLLTVSWRAFILLGTAGVIHFIVGRFLGYSAYRLIGANKATPFVMTNPFYTVIFGVLFLNEILTVYLVLGVICIFTGVALISTERKSVIEEVPGASSRKEVSGILTALGASLCWGTTPILIKPAVAEVGSPFAGAFISYVVAAVVMAFFFCRGQYRQQMGRIPVFIAALVYMLLGALCSSSGQLFFYTGLSYSPASVVNPLIATHILFVYLFSFLLNRHIEIFTPKIILGMAVVVVGTFFMFQ
jgi:drug/metabolite transporter (DMT)-like permease